MQILSLVVLSFYHFEGSFHFWVHLSGLVLRPFSTCSSLMLFSPFSRFLWILSLLVASFFFFFFLFFSFLLFLFFFFFFLSRASWGSFLSSVCDFFVFRLFVVLFVFDGPSSTQLFPYWFCSHQFAELGLIRCWAFSPRACSLACLSFAFLFLAICRAVFWYPDLFFSGLCLGLSLFSDSVDFSYSKGSLFKFFWGISDGSPSSALFFFLVLFLALRI